MIESYCRSLWPGSFRSSRPWAVLRATEVADLYSLHQASMVAGVLLLLLVTGDCCCCADVVAGADSTLLFDYGDCARAIPLLV